jgi:hypothetical protein
MQASLAFIPGAEEHSSKTQVATTTIAGKLRTLSAVKSELRHIR